MKRDIHDLDEQLQDLHERRPLLFNLIALVIALSLFGIGWFLASISK